MSDWTEYLKFMAAVFSVTNPFGVVPVFITLTAGYSRQERKSTARRTSLAFACVMIVILLAGDPLLGFFGITVSSFKAAGGIIILLMAISMVHAKVSRVKQTTEEAEDAADKASIAIVPLCTPLLAGPGAMSTVIVYSHQGTSATHYLVLGGGILVVSVSIWLCLVSAPYIAKLLGRTGMNVVMRIMGLVLAAIGVEFIAQGFMEMIGTGL
ncbi:MarC family protein [Pontiella sp.]|uniref:MarC family protein n=1 Tax=Pontiella sp. TaxID=2837462 RepID=UPI003561C86F